MSQSVRRIRDHWIALRCQLGEPGAFADLIAEVERPLLYYVTKLLRDENDALDVLQETWMRALRGVRRLHDPGSLRAWLFRIAHGLAVDRLRKAGSHRAAERARAQSLPEAGEEDPRFDEEDAAGLHAAINELDLEHREVIVLHFLDDLSIAEIAAVVDSPEGTVKSRIHHAKRALKHALMRGGYAKL